MQPIEQPTPVQLAKRRSNLERKQRQRAREKEQSHQALENELERRRSYRMNAEALIRRTQRNQCTFGEVAPGVDAKTVEDALEVTREMGRALGCVDVQENESLYDFERGVFESWVNCDKFVGRNDTGGSSPEAGGGHAPYLNRVTGELSPGRGRAYWLEHCGGFDECWGSLPGAKTKLDLATLPKLTKLKMSEQLEPEPGAPPPRAASIPHQPPDAMHFM